jgi:hypothetical protein
VIATCAIASGCGGSSGESGAADVTFERPDGSALTFPDTTSAWCGPFDDENPDVEAVHVLVGERSEEPTEALWTLVAVRADVEADATTTLPHGFVFTEPRGAVLFALDDAEHRQNELSSADEDSAGSIRVELSGCDPGGTVRLTFEDVTLASELHGAPAVFVDGTASFEIGAPP